MKTIVRLLSFLRPFIMEVCLSIFLGIAAIGTGVGMMGTSAYLIASAALHPSIAELQVAIVGVRFFGISRAAFRYLERLVSHSVNLHVLARLREWFYRRVESAPPAELFTYKSGDLLNRVMSDLETLENFYVRVVSPVVVATVVSIGTSLFVGQYAPELGWILLAGLFVNGLIMPLSSILMTRKLGKQMVAARADLSAQTVEWLQGLEVLQSNGAHQRWLDAISKKSKEAGSLQKRFSSLNGIASGMNVLFLNLTILLLLVLSIPMVRQGDMSGISMAVILLLGMASFEAVNNLPQAAVMLNASLESADRLVEVGSGQSREIKYEKLPDDYHPKTVEFRNVSFEYEEGGFHLEEISFSLLRGKKLALLGQSGAGKTSLINLLLRFWDAQGGSILLDGLDTRMIDPYQVRACFSVISQNVTLFSDSLRENLFLADPCADDEKLIEALRKVELGDWLQQLPDGLDTWLGDQGLRVSGGERQRIAIARALLQKRPFLLLDEPVEHLDPPTATKVLHTVFRLFEDCGILWITHDIASVQNVDEVLVLDKGIMTAHQGRAANTGSK